MHLLPGRVLQVAPVTEKDLFSFAGHKRAGALQAGPQADEIGDRHRGRRSPADPRHTTVRTRPDGARSGSLLGDGISRTAKHRPVMRWCFEPVYESGQGCVQEVWIVVSATGGEHE